jgi:large subunit ribosomal protein L23
MNKKDAYSIIKGRHVTEKATVLESLKTAESNKSVRAFKKSKYVFLVDKKATKHEIADAIEAIYAEQSIEVEKVNTITIRGIQKRTRGRMGKLPTIKKAVVTLTSEVNLDDMVKG